MANATVIHVRDLVGNGELADPTADVLDTGTAAVSLYTDKAVNNAELVVLKLENTAASDQMTVDVEAGANPPSFRAGIGKLTVTLAGQAIKWVGPFESARFLQADGTLKITSTPASTKTQTLKITCFRLPKNF